VAKSSTHFEVIVEDLGSGKCVDALSQRCRGDRYESDLLCGNRIRVGIFASAVY
jgi:hypothetical protein